MIKCYGVKAPYVQDSVIISRDGGDFVLRKDYVNALAETIEIYSAKIKEETRALKDKVDMLTKKLGEEEERAICFSEEVGKIVARQVVMVAIDRDKTKEKLTALSNDYINNIRM